MKSKKFLVLTAVGLLAVTGLVGCGKRDQSKSSGEASELPVPSVDDISLSIYKNDDEILVGAKTQVKASVSVSNGADKAVKFTSSDPSKISIDEDTGIATGIAKGSVQITATSVFDPSVSASVTLSVVDPYIRSVSASTTGVYLVLGDAEFGSKLVEAEANVLDFKPATLDSEVTFTSSDPSIASVVFQEGQCQITAVAEGQTTVIASAGEGDGIKKAIINVVVAPAGSATPADGARSFVYRSGEDKTKILGALEKYAVEQKLTGLTLYGDGGYVLYNPSVVKPVPKYVPGFGFGILSSGSINADLEGETNAAWKRYYHSFETSDPGSLNYMDDKGAVVGDLIGYVADGYFATYLNEEGNGYEWVGSLSKERRPRALNENPDTHLATQFEFEVKVGDELKYTTLSSTYSEFNNRPVALKDYLTPYQIYYTQAYGLARSAENLVGSGSLKGAKTLYNATKEGFNQAAWDAFNGVKAVEREGKAYLQFEFNQPCDAFYAMYYLSSSMFAPVPEEFIKAIGGGNLANGVATWGKSNEEGTLSPKDHWLSTGPYTVETWDKNQQIVFKRNPNWSDGEHYNIEGVHLNILTAAAQDPEAALKEFLANKIHACAIPSTKLKDYINDPRATTTADSSTYKLNLNTCDEATWESLFGVNGSIMQTPKSQYWKVEPAMNNKDFVDGLSFALNRKELAESLGRTATPNYFGSAYMSDPESGIAYNNTPEHKAAVASLVGEAAGTDEFGFSLEAAQVSFKKAADQLIADGVYKAGQTIEIEIAWQTTAQISTTHDPIKKYLETAFNTPDNPLKLSVKSWVGAVWSDVYYVKMMTGQFDIGFGSISGNTYNPLNFLEVLKSDNSSGFTLNWGLDTNSVDGNLVWEGEVYSFDALWTAADQGAYIEQGQNAPLDFSAVCESYEFNADGDLVVSVLAHLEDIDNGSIVTSFAGLMFYGYTAEGDYDEFGCENFGKKFAPDANQEGIVDYLAELLEMDAATVELMIAYGYLPTLVRFTVVIDGEKIAPFNNEYNNKVAPTGRCGLDAYFIVTMFGLDGDPAYTDTIEYFLTGCPAPAAADPANP